MAATYTNIVLDGGAAVTIGSDLGAIKDGVHIQPTFEIYRVEGIEGCMTSPVARRTKEVYAITFTLLEVTIANLKLAWDVTNAESPAGTLDFGGDSAAPNARALVVTGKTPGATKYARTFTFTTAILVSCGELLLSDYGEQAFNCTYETLWDATNSRLGEIVDSAA